MNNKLSIYLQMALSQPQRALVIYKTEDDLNELETAFLKESSAGLMINRLSQASQSPATFIWKPDAEQFSQELNLYKDLNDLHILILAFSEKEFAKLEDSLQNEVLSGFTPIFRF